MGALWSILPFTSLSGDNSTDSNASSNSGGIINNNRITNSFYRATTSSNSGGITKNNHITNNFFGGARKGRAKRFLSACGMFASYSI